MKNLAVIFILSPIFCNLSRLKAQMVTYSGPVEYHFEITNTASGGGTDGGYNWNVSVKEKQIINGSFYVTFAGGNFSGISSFRLTSIDENIQYVNTVNNEGNDQKTSQPCYDDRLVFKHNATPGDSRTRRNSVQSSRVNPEKPVIEGGTLMFKNGKYTFVLMGKMKVSITSESYSSETFPCWDTIIPPKSISNSTTFDFPIVISGEKIIETRDVLEGIYVKENETSDDCSKCLGALARMAHGDMNCSHITNITTSWTLVKRTKECEAVISHVKGDVKINGVPVKNGSFKIGAGDVMETGSKSRIQLSLNNNSTVYRLGSKSKLLLSNPCELYNEEKIKQNKTISATLLKGKLYGLINKLVGSERNFEPNIRTTASGVRGQLWQPPNTFFASINPNSSLYLYQQEDPEKAELIEGYENSPSNVSAFYIHYEDDVVKDISALKGTLKIEDHN